MVVDLLVIGLTHVHDLASAVPPESRHRALLWRIHTFIEQHLAEPGFGPAAIAAAHHVSERQLHRLFEQENATVAESIGARRLERCRRDLTDPGLRDLTVAAVASRWGFTSAAHFNRLFRATYGQTPGALRRARLT